MNDWCWGNEALDVAAVPQPTPDASYGGGYSGVNPNSAAWDANSLAIVNGFLDLDLCEMRERSRELFETNAAARGIIRRLVTNEVHTGLELEADAVSLILGRSEDDLATWNDKTEAYFSAWANTPEVCDFQRRPEMTLGEQTATARREALVGGDCLVVVRMHSVTKLPTVQIFAAHLVATPPMFTRVDLAEGREIVDGVELNAQGRHVAYYVVDPATGDHTRIEAIGRKSGQRLAWLMYGVDRRIGQVRGTPLLSVIMQSLKEIDRYRESAQRKAVINSILTMWIEKSEDKIGSAAARGSAVRTDAVSDTGANGKPRSYSTADLIPGLILEELQHGEKPHAFKSDGGEATSYPNFYGAIIAGIAWACEMPAEILTLSFNSNYSASQAALNEFTMYLGAARERIANSFNQPIYVEWLIASVRNGTLTAPGLLESVANDAEYATRSAWTNAAWIGSVKPVTDIWKTVRANETMVDRGWTTNARVSRSLTGTKFSTNARVLKRERKELPPDEPPLADPQ